MSVRTREYTYPRTNRKGEEKLHTFTYTYKIKSEAGPLGKQKLRDKITSCSSEEQMQKLLIFMAELGL